MRVIEYDSVWDLYLLEHKGYRFQALKKDSGENAYYEPVNGDWNTLAASTNQDFESLAEELDDACYCYDNNIEDK